MELAAGSLPPAASRSQLAARSKTTGTRTGEYL